MSTKIILALLGLIIIVILLLTSQRFTGGLRNRFSGLFPGIQQVEKTTTPTPKPTSVAHMPTPTKIQLGTGRQTQTKGGPIAQTPDTGATEISFVMISSFGIVGYTLRRLTRNLNSPQSRLGY